MVAYLPRREIVRTLRRLIVTAVLAGGCDGKIVVQKVDWKESLPYWDPCGQFKTEPECPFGCDWVREGTHAVHHDLGCYRTLGFCETDADCNVEQVCKQFQAAECVNEYCDGSASYPKYCDPYSPPEDP